MFTIGEFSRITQLSVKALRLYHDQGLLTPVKIDADSGYRYYDEKSIQHAEVIKFLKSLDLSLEAIHDIITRHTQDADILEYIQAHQLKIEEQIKKYKEINISLTQFITYAKEENMDKHVSAFEIEEKQSETQLIASIRYLGRYDAIGSYLGKIARKFARVMCGKPFNLYWDTEFKDEGADIETCIPIRKGTSTDDITVRELTGGPCVSLIHKGPYTTIGKTYARITAYVNEHGYTVTLPTREIYLKGPGMIFRGNPNNYLTEIQMLVTKKD